MGADNTFGEESFKPIYEAIISDSKEGLDDHRLDIPEKHPTDEQLYLALQEGKITFQEYLNRVIPIKKPPLGLTPRTIWEEKTYTNRILSIKEAIGRYDESGKEIPIEWIEEYNELIDKTKLDK